MWWRKTTGGAKLGTGEGDVTWLCIWFGMLEFVKRERDFELGPSSSWAVSNPGRQEDWTPFLHLVRRAFASQRSQKIGACGQFES